MTPRPLLAHSFLAAFWRGVTTTVGVVCSDKKAKCGNSVIRLVSLIYCMRAS